MNVVSRVVVCACVAALIAGCGSVTHRSGKGSDHEVVSRPINTQERKVVQPREVVYVQQPYVYYQPVPVYQPAPAYRVVTARPEYSTVTSRPSYRYVPVTRYYYVE